MKISDLMSLLKNIKEKDGDLEVKLNNSDYGTLSDLQCLGIGFENEDGDLTDEETERSKLIMYISY